jgi:hypothetical protein
VQGIQNGKIAFPGHAKGAGRAKGNKRLHQKLAAILHRAFLSRRVSLS